MVAVLGATWLAIQPCCFPYSFTKSSFFLLQIFRRADKNGECFVPAAASCSLPGSGRSSTACPCWEVWLKEDKGKQLSGCKKNAFLLHLEEKVPEQMAWPGAGKVGSPNSPSMCHRGQSPF